MSKLRYIITDYGFCRHFTAAGAYSERGRLQELYSDMGKDFRVLTVIDEPKADKFARDRGQITEFEYDAVARWRGIEPIDRDSYFFNFVLTMFSHVTPWALLVVLLLGWAPAPADLAWWAWPLIAAAALHSTLMLIMGIQKRAEIVATRKARKQAEENRVSSPVS